MSIHYSASDMLLCERGLTYILTQARPDELIKAGIEINHLQYKLSELFPIKEISFDTTFLVTYIEDDLLRILYVYLSHLIDTLRTEYKEDDRFKGPALDRLASLESRVVDMQEYNRHLMRAILSEEDRPIRLLTTMRDISEYSA